MPIIYQLTKPSSRNVCPVMCLSSIQCVQKIYFFATLRINHSYDRESIKTYLMVLNLSLMCTYCTYLMLLNFVLIGFHVLGYLYPPNQFHAVDSMFESLWSN